MATCVCLHLARHAPSLRVLVKGGLADLLRALCCFPGPSGPTPRVWPPWVISAIGKLSKAVIAGKVTGMNVQPPGILPPSTRSRMYTSSDRRDHKRSTSLPG